MAERHTDNENLDSSKDNTLQPYLCPACGDPLNDCPHDPDEVLKR